MDHVKQLQKRKGVDIGSALDCCLHPVNGEGCVGKRGINKNFTLIQMIELAYKMVEKPNILVKAGPNAKWYIKKYDTKIIEEEIEKPKWKDVSRCTLYIIQWDE